ncbi:hypothetical protein JRQ81_019527 [Phrynocephalus forsythii]|uniref:Uncharacterized protein n=1 Tax=Phrynocephalus forsythii TaxID=171643 RepID=A0A9Q1AYL2_9SAUR|nr:hypothetical protein JRQ81_019527 [Phrynocephalus forsythii]
MDWKNIKASKHTTSRLVMFRYLSRSPLVILTRFTINMEALLSSGIKKAKQIVKQRIEDTEYQTDLTSIQNMAVRSFVKNLMEPAKYLTALEAKGSRRAFTLARCLALPSAELEGKYKNTPFAERLCSCPLREIETIEHMFFTCPLYEAAHKEIIFPLMESIPRRSEGKRLEFLLSDADTKITCQVARFCVMILRLRKLNANQL